MFTWLAKLLGERIPEDIPVSKEPAPGSLYGYEPPHGCHFNLTEYAGSWHVRIRMGKETLVHECAIGGWEGVSSKELITKAARRALNKYRNLQIQGDYPPRTLK